MQILEAFSLVQCLRFPNVWKKKGLPSWALKSFVTASSKKICSNSLWYLETSVDVPPISNPITGLNSCASFYSSYN